MRISPSSLFTATQSLPRYLSPAPTICSPASASFYLTLWKSLRNFQFFIKSPDVLIKVFTASVHQSFMNRHLLMLHCCLLCSLTSWFVTVCATWKWQGDLCNSQNSLKLRFKMVVEGCVIHFYITSWFSCCRILGWLTVQRDGDQQEHRFAVVLTQSRKI